MTYQQLAREVRERLSRHYPDGEARWMTRIIFEEIKGYNQVDMAIHADDTVSEFIAGKVNGVVDRLMADEPIQYIFGSARFHGLKLKVSPATLIPRPETDELVDIIVDENGRRDDLRVLDVGTGSGCIAIALARSLPFSMVEAIDISPEAVAVARENAESLRTRIKFTTGDILTANPPVEIYDIIVSNPPYIMESERNAMEPNVLDHEPSTALFVPDSDPLRFYHAIARYASKALRPSGRLYFETNPLTTDSLARDLVSDGWENVSVIPDSSGKKRFISATHP